MCPPKAAVHVPQRLRAEPRVRPSPAASMYMETRVTAVRRWVTYGDLRFHQLLGFGPAFIETRIQKEVCKPQGPSSIWEALTSPHPLSGHTETGPPRVGTQPQRGGAGREHSARAVTLGRLLILGHAREPDATSSPKELSGRGPGWTKG